MEFDLHDSFVEPFERVGEPGAVPGVIVSALGEPNPAVVFTHHGVLDPEQSFDRPAASQHLQQCCGVGLIGRQAGDRIGHRMLRLAVDRGDAFQFEKTIQARPLSMFDTLRTRRKNSSLNTTATLLTRLHNSNVFFRFTSGTGGKPFGITKDC